MKVFNSYSDVMFSPDKLRRVIAELAAHLPTLKKDYAFDTIVVSGKSGAALGFALSMVSDINVVFVRKGESTHGDMIEGPRDHEFTRYAFFDDFIASGNTRDRVHDELSNYADTRSSTAPQRVLTITYQNGPRRTGMNVHASYPHFRVAEPDYLPAPSLTIQ